MTVTVNLNKAERTLLEEVLEGKTIPSSDSSQEKSPLPDVGFYGGKFSPFHLGHVSAILKASSQVKELHVAVVVDEVAEKTKLYAPGKSKVPFISAKERARIVKETFRNFPHIKVHYAYQPDTGDEWEDWAVGARNIIEAIGKPIDKIFSSESSYTEFFDSFYPGAEHIVVDEPRKDVPISSTKIREEGAFKHWAYLPEATRKRLVKKVALIGTESNGKSTLTEMLALYFNTSHVKEYGRTYMEEVGDTLTLPEDYPLIASQHFLEVEKAKGKANKVLFSDTEAFVTQNFSELYEGIRNPLVEEFSKIQAYDLYLFLDKDVPWVNDGTRLLGGDEIRDKASENLKKLLKEQGVTYFTITGDYQERFRQAVKILEEEIYSKH